VTDRELITDPDISLDTNNIGGPSAGLMMTLEIYNQLTEEDYTKGYHVAGTGTIDENGTVGPIGGISQKIVAADKSGAEIFFAPNQNGIAASNYKEAAATAKDIETDMKIVPIDTFDDAVDYLKSLKEK
jgi:PDZ domain-containing protein